MAAAASITPRVVVSRSEMIAKERTSSGEPLERGISLSISQIESAAIRVMFDHKKEELQKWRDSFGPEMVINPAVVRVAIGDINCNAKSEIDTPGGIILVDAEGSTFIPHRSDCKPPAKEDMPKIVKGPDNAFYIVFPKKLMEPISFAGHSSFVQINEGRQKRSKCYC